MDTSKYFSILVFPVLKIVFFLLLGVAGVGIVVGVPYHIATGGKPPKEPKNKNWLDKALYFGMVVSYLLIGLVTRRIRKKPKIYSTLSDEQLLWMLKGMSDKQFEEFVANMFLQLEYKSEVVGGPGDNGIDIKLEKNGKKYLVQCKRYLTSKVPKSELMEFNGVLEKENADAGCLVTTSEFTEAATKWAKGTRIKLVDNKELIGLIRQSKVIGSEVPAK